MYRLEVRMMKTPVHALPLWDEHRVIELPPLPEPEQDPPRGIH